MSMSHALAKNGALQILGKVFATIFGIFTVAVLTRYLGANGFGELTIILTFLSIFAVIVDFGLTLTTVQMISEKKADENQLIGNLLSLRIVSAVIFLSLAPIIAIFFPYDAIIKIGIAVGAVSYLFGSTSQMMVGIFQKRLIMGRVVLAEFLNRGAVFIGALLAPVLGFGLIGIVWLFVIGNALQLLSLLYFAKSHVSLRFRWNTKIFYTIIKRSWPIGASIFFNLIYLRGDILFLSLYRSTNEIGLYGAAYKVVDVITVIPVMYMGLVLPILVALWSKGAKKDFSTFMQNTFDFFSVLALPIIFGTIILGIPVMELIAGSDFSESGAVLAILGPAAAIVFFNSLFGHAVVAVNKQKPMVFAYLFVAVMTIAGYIIFIPLYGMWAAAWWTLIAETLIGILSFLMVWKSSTFVPQINMFLRALIASVIMYFALTVMPSIHVLLQITFGALVYAIALTALGGPKPKEILKLFLPEKPPIAIP